MLIMPNLPEYTIRQFWKLRVEESAEKFLCFQDVEGCHDKKNRDKPESATA
jgi:hypothetical protein